MANNCTTNWIVVSRKEEPIRELCKKFNLLHDMPQIPWWGKGAFRNLARVLGFSEDVIKTMCLKGFITPNPWLESRANQSGDNLMGMLFEYHIENGTYRFRFSTQSAYDVPKWFTEYLENLKIKEGIEFDYRASDEFGNYYKSRNGQLVGKTYVINTCDSTYEYNIGEEDEFALQLANLIGVTPDKEMIYNAKQRLFSDILREVKNMNMYFPGAIDVKIYS